MSSAGGGNFPSYYAKEWDPIFSQHREFHDDKFFVDIIRDIIAADDDIGYFWRDSQQSEEPLAFSKSEVLEKFCKNASLQDLKSGTLPEIQRRAAWLDDRSLLDVGCPFRGCCDLNCSHLTTNTLVRNHNNPLTGTGLYRLLKELRFGHSDKVDVDRRLIYIANLDPYYILALLETANQHQMEVLKEAIWKHLQFQTSVSVKIPTRGYLIFQLRLHLPFFSLRTSPPPRGLSQKGINSRPSRDWIDLAPLPCGLYEAQFSLVICGWHNRRITVYAFDDIEFDSINFEEDLGEANSSFHRDPIASEAIVDANNPIWDPRLYYLTIFELRIARVQKEWERVIQAISSSKQPDLGVEAHRGEDLKETFNRTQRTLQLLRRLLDVVSKLTDAWERFNSVNGDIGYFAPDSLPASVRLLARRSLFEINQKFEILKCLQRDLTTLHQNNESSAQALKLFLILESNEATKQNGMVTELGLSLTFYWVISPFALAAAYCSMPETVLPFKPNSKSFIISIFVIMIVVRLLFVLLGALVRRPWIWRKVMAWKKMSQLDDLYKELATRGNDRELSVRRCYTDNVEIGNWESQG